MKKILKTNNGTNQLASTSAIQQETRLRMGDALASIGRKIGLTDEDLAIVEELRERVSVEPLKI